MKRDQLHALTSLRFFAAAAIVLLHMQGKIIPMQHDVRLGLGVSFFFVLSGFILTYVYREFQSHSIWTFYRARFARLWPVHLVTFVLAAAFVMPHALFKAQWVTTIPANLTLTQAWFPISGLVFSWNGPSWSISAEAWFYILFPLLVASGRFWMAFLAVGAAAVGIVAYIDMMDLPLGRTAPFTFSPFHMIMQHPAVRALEFAVGVAAGRAFNAGYRIRLLTPTSLEVAAIAAVLAFAATTYAGRIWIHSVSPAFGLWYSQSGGALIFATAIFVFAQGAGGLSATLTNRWLVLLGEISFCTYMVHQIIIKVAAKAGAVEAIGWPATVILLLPAIYGASWLLWRYVEVPARRAILGQQSRGSLSSLTPRSKSDGR